MSNDVELLRRYAVDNDAYAFSLLAKRYGGMVYGVCLRITGNEADAEDIVQECFLQLAQSAASIGRGLSSWLHTLAYNRSLNLIRARKSRNRYEMNGTSNHHSEVTAWSEVKPHVDEAINSLPVELSEPILLHFFEGRTQAETAAELGVDQSTVSRRIKEGISRLRARLERAGIVVSVAALMVLLSENAACAAPVELTASLVKMGIAGVGKNAPVAPSVPVGNVVMKAIAVAALVILCIAGIPFLAPKEEAAGPIATQRFTPIPAPASEESGKINVLVDPRIELLGVIQLISGYSRNFPSMCISETFYMSEVHHYFKEYAQHPAVKQFRMLSSEMFTYEVPVRLMFHLSEPPLLKEKSHIPEDIVWKTGSQERLDEFLKALRDFAQRTHFMNFFRSQEAGFEKFVKETRTALEGFDYIGLLEEYYGQKLRSCNVVLAPLFWAGYWEGVERTEDSLEHYVICWPLGARDGIPYFGGREYFRANLLNRLSSEFSYPITRKFEDEVDKCSSLFEPISNEMYRITVRSWDSCFSELVGRAVAVRLTYRELGEQEGRRELISQMSRGFVYVDALCKQLEEYEQSRFKYPTLEDYYPELLRTLQELQE